MASRDRLRSDMKVLAFGGNPLLGGGQNDWAEVEGTALRLPLRAPLLCRALPTFAFPNCRAFSTTLLCEPL